MLTNGFNMKTVATDVGPNDTFEFLVQRPFS